MPTLFLDRYESPIGIILLVMDEGRRLRALDFADHESRMRQLLQRHYGTCKTLPLPAPTAIRDALDAYFDGDLQALSGISQSKISRIETGHVLPTGADLEALSGPLQIGRDDLE
ncbi:MAG: helix-turn-helix domain-containing protein, partial [Alphaproteobacteria bacterium]|nr:helix-turn-helix domain-containing protein [Alphaproteobacteria bacterium]